MGKRFRPYWIAGAAMSAFILVAMLVRGDMAEHGLQAALAGVLLVVTVLLAVRAP